MECQHEEICFIYKRKTPPGHHSKLPESKNFATSPLLAAKGSNHTIDELQFLCSLKQDHFERHNYAMTGRTPTSPIFLGKRKSMFSTFFSGGKDTAPKSPMPGMAVGEADCLHDALLESPALTAIWTSSSSKVSHSILLLIGARRT